MEGKTEEVISNEDIESTEENYNDGEISIEFTKTKVDVQSNNISSTNNNKIDNNSTTKLFTNKSLPPKLEDVPIPPKRKEINVSSTSKNANLNTTLKDTEVLENNHQLLINNTLIALSKIYVKFETIPLRIYQNNNLPILI